MPLDGISVRCLAQELSSSLIGSSIQKIFQPGKEVLIFHMKLYKSTEKLLFSAGGAAARCQITATAPDNPIDAPMFCMLLRKHLTGAKLMEIKQLGYERVLHFIFNAKNELGDSVTRTIVCEMMGKYSNIILLDENNRIIDAIHRVDMTISSKRLVLPGLLYENPPEQNKEILSTNVTLPEEYSPRYLSDRFSGVSPLAARELMASDFHSLVHAIEEKSFSPCVVFDSETDKPMDFWSLPITQYSGIAKKIDTATLSEAMDLYYSAKEQKERLAAKAYRIHRTVKTLLERAEKKLSLQLETLEASRDAEKIRERAELIQANLYQISEGDKVVCVQNYFLEDVPTIEIPLDPQLSPVQNAQKLFKRYRKLKTAGQFALEQAEISRIEIAYLSDILRALDDADDETVISEIRSELTDQGYIRPEQGKKRRTQKKSVPTPMTFIQSGITIYVGKNNIQNEYVTFKLGRANDIWLHAKDMPGSHVLIKCPLEELPDDVLEFAAEKAARYSDAHGAPKTAVDYTSVKYVKKQPGGKPGMVFYTDFYTIYTK